MKKLTIHLDGLELEVLELLLDSVLVKSIRLSLQSMGSLLRNLWPLSVRETGQVVFTGKLVPKKLYFDCNLSLFTRFTKATAPRHMMYGASMFLSYDIITELLRHHDESNLRPQIVDHLFALALIGTGTGLTMTNTPAGALRGFLFFTIVLGPLSMWIKNLGIGSNAHR